MGRSTEKELLDTGEFETAEYEDCLVQLDRVGRWLGGDRATSKALAALPSPRTILDLGCGGGFYTDRLGKMFPDSQVLGVDIAEEAIRFTEKRTHPSNVAFQCSRLEDLSESFDLIVVTLVCHHLSDSELPTFLQHVLERCSGNVIINDLHRHPLAYAAFVVLAPPLFRNRLITHDGLISIKRAFTRSDWIRLLRGANIVEYAISWCFPFRWMVRIPCQ
jgi:2-polyprenyl-3-methyl-5-hydroxy-6-metoxy-1,4-benzoquinol methylase